MSILLDQLRGVPLGRRVQLLDRHLRRDGCGIQAQVGQALGVERLLLGLHDALERGVADFVHPCLNRQQSRQRHADDLQRASLELALDGDAAIGCFGAHDAGRVRNIEQLGQHGSDEAEVRIVRHQAAEDQIRALFPRDRSKRLRDAQGVGLVGRLVFHVDGAIRAHSEGRPQALDHAVRPDRDDNDLGVAGVLDAQRRFQAVVVVVVDLELQVRVVDPGAVAADFQASVAVRHLLQADEDLHGAISVHKGADRPRGGNSRTDLKERAGAFQADPSPGAKTPPRPGDRSA
jgi:hypothetical protein